MLHSWRRAWWAALGVLMLVSTGCGTVITPPLPTLSSVPISQGDAAVTPTGDAAVFLTPIPPTATLTPSPTPTPVLHTVQSGDTLLGIALEYGISVDALQAANGLDNPQFLSIGQALIIPMGETMDLPDAQTAPVDSVILPTPTPLPLEIVGVSLSHTAVGGFLCAGEVQNNMDVATTNHQVQAVLVDPAGTPLVSGVTMAVVDYLRPGERAPFSVLFQDPPPTASDVQVQLLRAESVSTVQANFLPLTAVELDGNVSGPQYRVKGQVVNENAESIAQVRIVVVLYDAQGQVLGYRLETLAEEIVLGSGERVEFSVLLISKGAAVPDTFKVLAWGNFAG